MSFQTLIGHSLIHTAGSAVEPFTRSVTYTANKVVLNEMPSVEALMDAARRGLVRESDAEGWLRWQGVALNVSGQNSSIVAGEYGTNLQALWNRMYYAGGELLTGHDVLVLTNRGVLKPSELGKNLRTSGYVAEATQKAFANLRYEVPGPSDLVRFAVRHVFEPELVAKFTYPAERDQGPFLLDIFHQAAGINYPIFTGPLAPTVRMVTGRDPQEFVQLYAAAGLPEPTWADAYWWSHWVLPSPSQGYEMLFRLREDRLHEFDPPGTSGENFTLSDLNLLLRANDYPPYYRGKLAAIAYRIPGIRFMRELVRTGVWGPRELLDLLLRQGYSPGDAQALVTMLARSDRDARRGKVESQAHGQLARYWEIGILTRNDYQALLQQHGMSAEDAAATVELAFVDSAAKKAQRTITFVRRQYIKGAVDRLQANGMLGQAGVQDPQRTDYLDEWSLEIVARHREISADKAIRLACRGLVSLDELSVRLINLGYTQDDVRILSAEAIQCAQERAATLAAKATRAERQRQSDLIAAQRRAAQQIREARQALASHGSPAQLRKWYCEGHVSQAEVFQRLTFLGWPDADIGRLIADCKSAPGSGSGGSGGGRAPRPASP